MDTDKLDYPDTHDRILDAYFGKLGEGFMRDTQKRVHWVCGQVQGRRVLDVGCSQGIVPFLLAREGYQVTGIDSDPEAIAVAQTFLAQQSSGVQKNVTLINDDFASYPFADNRFDSVIISEVLEHLITPASFVALAAQLLNSGGRLIVTVPFGINDYIDHKRTYYALEPLRLLWEHFAVDEVELFGKWIGFSCSKRPEAISDGLTAWPWSLFAEMETSFQNIERGLLDQVLALRSSLDKTNEKYRAVNEQVAQLKKQLNGKDLQENALAAKDEQLRLGEESLLQLRREMAGICSRADAAEQSSRELTEQLEQLHEKKRKVDDALAAALRDIDIEQSQRLSIEAAIVALREEAASRQARTDAEIGASVVTINSLQANLAETQTALEEARRKYRAINEQITDLKEKLVQKDAALAKANQDLISAQNGREFLQESLNQQQLQADEQHQKLTQVIAQKEADLQTQEAALRLQQKENIGLSASLQEANNKYREVTDRSLLLHDLLAQNQSELESAQQEVEREQAQRITAEKEVLRLYEQSKYQQALAEEALCAKEEQIVRGKEALQKRRIDTETARTQLQKENVRLLGEIAELQRQFHQRRRAETAPADKELEIQRLRKQLAEALEANSKVQGADSAQNEEVAALKRELTERNEELATARKEELALRETLAGVEDDQQKSRNAYIKKSSELELSQALYRAEQYRRAQDAAALRSCTNTAVDIALILKNTKVACIMDEFTYGSYRSECNLLQLTPQYWQQELDQFAPELLMIESAWRGKDDLWWNTVPRNCAELTGIIAWCHEHQVPTVFWCKEDPVHFETFLNTAKLFDHVFTTDIDCIHRYKGALGHERVYLLPFACQPQTTNPLETYERKDAFCFAGAYYLRYPERTRDLGNFVSTLAGYRPVEIFDRNYGKSDLNYQFPAEYQPFIVGNLPFEQIDKAYKGYRYAINLNSIKQSQSMFARRVFDLLASNTLTVSNFSRGVRLLFGDLVITTDNGDEIVRRLKTVGTDEPTLRKYTLAGLRKVMQEHTYQDRFAYIVAKVQGGSVPNLLPPIVVTAYAQNQAEFDVLIESFARQSYSRRRLLLIFPGGFSPDNMPDDARIQVLNCDEIAGVRISEVLAAREYVAAMVPYDYYGRNYLLDLALATRYSNAVVIGKATHYVWSATAGLSLAGEGQQYRPADSVAVRCSLARAEVVEELLLDDWLTTLDSRLFEAGELFGIDECNYCANGHTEEFLTRYVETVNDLAGLNHGIGMDELIVRSEKIAPVECVVDTSPVLSGAKFASYFNLPNNKACAFSIAENDWEIEATLAEGVIEYLYPKIDFSPADLGYTDRVRFHLDVTGELDLQMVMLFLDEHGQRTGHIIRSSNRNHEAEIPAGTTSIRFGLRLFGQGKARINALVLGHRLLQPAEVLGQAQHLILTDHYPAYDDLYRNGFVHSRVTAYRERGIRTDIFRLRGDEALSFSEFQDIDVITGSQEALHKLLAAGRYQSILVHFLNERMWPVLQQHLEQIPVYVWVHGAEIQPWQRRDYNYVTEADLAAAKVLSDARMTFWRGVLDPLPAQLKLIFVSRYFAEEVMEDLGFRLPEESYSIIHNPIDTNLFAYQEKAPEQRKKILSIRPYASRKYANDLSVQAILSLSKRPWFNELEIRLIGDGVLFEDTLAPLRGFANVMIEKRFLTHGEIAAMHRDYGLFLCPTRMDAQGVSKDEAMSSGLIPVTNGVTAIPEFVDETCGILAAGEDAAGMAAGIADLYDHPDKFLAMSQAAAQRVRGQSAASVIIDKELRLFHRVE